MLCITRYHSLVKELDGILRCGICYEYIKTAMITTCSHNYCSLCIRKSLMYKPNCPSCFQTVSDSQLRNNKLVDNIISIFLHFSELFESQPQNNSHEKSTNETNTTHHLLDVRDDISKLPKSKKEILESPCKPSTSFSASKIIEKETNDVGDSNDSDINVSKEETLKQECYSTSKVEQIPSMFTPKKKKSIVEPVNLVPCPVCNVEIPERNINLHLDDCLKRSETMEKSSSKHVEKRKPLPKLVYTLIGDKELRKKLKDLGLNNQGHRKALISRHQRYTLLYNSECDMSNPRSAAEIIQQVEREEKEESKSNTASISSMLKIDRKTDPKVIEQVHQQYLQQNKKSYEDLIRQIRNRQEAKKSSAKPNRIESDEEDVNTNTTEERTDRKPAVNCINDSDSDDNGITSSNTEKQTSSCSEENGIEVMDETDYESDTENAASPVLGRQVGTVPMKTENEAWKLTPDMFVTQGVSQNVNSSGSFKVLTQTTAPVIVQNEEENDEPSGSETKQCHRMLDSQIADPDYVPDIEDITQDFVVKKKPSRGKRKVKKTSNSVSVAEGRNLRKRQKH